MSPQLLSDIERSMRELETCKGQVLMIDESISRHRNEPYAHDRHFATLSRFTFRLHHVGWTISGGAIMLDGGSDAHASFYQVAIDELAAVHHRNRGSHLR